MKISERKFSETVYATKKSGKDGIVILFIISGSEVVRKTLQKEDGLLGDVTHKEEYERGEQRLSDGQWAFM